jgi:choice-of-anchor A domain-containing protein
MNVHLRRLPRPGRLLLAITLALPVAALAAPLPGPAAGYNVFVGGAFTGTFSDVEGNLAAGGNVSLNGYSVASEIAGNGSVVPNAARLVVGGSLNASNGGVGQGQGGAIYLNGSRTGSGFTATGGTNPGGVTASALFDFAAAMATYSALSTQIGGLSANGTTTQSFSSLSLTGSSTTVNVFNVSVAQLNGTNTVNISAPAASTVLINITGSGTPTFQNGQVFLQNGLTESRILWNLPNATALSLPGSKNPNGTILAPFAAVTGGFGALDGQLIAGSFSGNTAFHLRDRDGSGGGSTYFNGDLPQVPVPGALAMLLPGLALVGGLAWRRRTA